MSGRDSAALNNKETLFEDNDEILLFAEDDDAKETKPGEKWKVMIVDDEYEVHNVTKLVLNDFEFSGRSLEFLSAFSGEEAIKLIKENPDTAVMLLDVVMEEDDTGLKVVKFIREELNNNLVRIVLRTGQPGQAPERKVILDYDINDYKEKTELTAQKLFTTMVSSIRAYRDINMIYANKRGLEKMIDSSAYIFQIQSLRQFTLGVLNELNSILNENMNCTCTNLSGFSAIKDEEGFGFLAGIGVYSKGMNKNIRKTISDKTLKVIEKAISEKKSLFYEDSFVIYANSEVGAENIIYIEGVSGLTDIDIDFIEIFCGNISIALDNIYLNKELESTQKEIIFTLGEISEARSQETGYHVKRVAEYSKLLALKYGLSEEESELIRVASPMHDIGKLGIPDAILNKPGKLTNEEFDVIKTHAAIGHDMLKTSKREILKTAAIIAYEHHEKYNGEGYPRKIKGEDIHIYGRITAVADVFDALCSERVYKKAWELEDILNLYREERGRHFDPKLIDIFFENLDDFLAIRDRFKDMN